MKSVVDRAARGGDRAAGLRLSPLRVCIAVPDRGG
ncbi:hypothetical protein CHUV2995_03121 [Corynebacterium diphtheriae subsp. lausannense]|nr:hypothetical protein CHUV2995_03121 [Corynebacterium diphtheriae subsp. lausannense]